MTCPLSAAEQDVLQLLADGLSCLEVAAERGTSPSSVRTQIHAVLRKLGCDSAPQAVVRAFREGWVLIDPTPQERMCARLEMVLTEVNIKLASRQPMSPQAERALAALQARPRSETAEAAIDRLIDAMYQQQKRRAA